jgi:hypothetical protein
MLIVITSCSLGFDVEEEQPIDKHFKTVHEAWIWIARNVEYVSDRDVHGKEEYWQYPWETYQMKTGDCEDYAILFMYFMEDMGIKSEFIAIEIEGYGFHAAVCVNDQILSPQQYGRYHYVEEDDIINRFSYRRIYNMIRYKR